MSTKLSKRQQRIESAKELPCYVIAERRAAERARPERSKFLEFHPAVSSPGKHIRAGKVLR